MPQAPFHRILSVALGIALGGMMFWLGIDLLLSSAIGLAFTTALALLLRTRREFPNRWTGEGWREGRWTAVSLISVNFSALVGVQLVPLSGGYQAAVSFVVILTGLTAYVGGSLAEMERDTVCSDHKSSETVVDDG
jgi:integral membrane sensor domain MASE1